MSESESDFLRTSDSDSDSDSESDSNSNSEETEPPKEIHLVTIPKKRTIEFVELWRGGYCTFMTCPGELGTSSMSEGEAGTQMGEM